MAGLPRSGTVTVIGAAALVGGWGLAGVRVCAADDAASAQVAWESLPADTALVILTPTAAEHLAGRRSDWPLTVELP